MPRLPVRVRVESPGSFLVIGLRGPTPRGAQRPLSGKQERARVVCGGTLRGARVSATLCAPMGCGLWRSCFVLLFFAGVIFFARDSPRFFILLLQ